VDRIHGLRVRFQQPILNGLHLAPNAEKGVAQLVGHVAHHVPAQLLVACQAPGHRVEGPGQLAYLIAGFHPHPLAQVPPLHRPRGPGKGLYGAEDAAGQDYGKKQGQQGRNPRRQKEGAVDRG